MPVFGVVAPNLLQTLVEDIGVAMLVIDAAERVVFANRMALELFDFTSSPEGLRFRDLRSKTRFEDPAGNEIPLAQAIVIRALKNQPVASQEARFKKAGGKNKWLIGRAYRISSLGIDGVAVFVVDETAEVEARKASALLERMETTGTLAAGLTHDFNNVLETIALNVDLLKIALNVDLLKENGGYAPEVGARLVQISGAVNKGTGLVRHLMQFGRQDLHLRSTDVNDIVRDVVRFAQPMLRDRINLTLDLGEDLPAVSADSSQLERVLVNLIVNALDAMPVGGDLTIATHVAQGDQKDSARKGSIGQEQEEIVQLSISDTGTGIPDEIQSKIFEPFFTTKSKGTGLGLSSAFRIVYQHGGKIGVDSSPGMGATFTVSLPVHDPASLGQQLSAGAVHCRS